MVVGIPRLLCLLPELNLMIIIDISRDYFTTRESTRRLVIQWPCQGRLDSLKGRSGYDSQIVSQDEKKVPCLTYY